MVLVGLIDVPWAQISSPLQFWNPSIFISLSDERFLMPYLGPIPIDLWSS